MKISPTLLAAAFLCSSSALDAQTTSIQSVSSNGTLSDLNSYAPTVSADGRFVAFSSVASNLVPGAIAGSEAVYVRDLSNGTTECASLTWNGVFDRGSLAALSADGRYVAFRSGSSGIVPGDANSKFDVFVRDRASSSVQIASTAASGGQANQDSDRPAISGDGRYVAFVSSASNLVPGDTNALPDVFVKDRVTGALERVSISGTGAQASGASDRPALSHDGRFVAFSSAASDLVTGDTNGVQDVFVRDRLLGTSELVSTSSTGVLGNLVSGVPSISADGRFVAFESDAANLVALDSNASGDVFVKDRTTNVTTRVSVRTSGAEASGSSSAARISADGFAVAFHSGAALAPGDTNGQYDAYVHDRASHTTSLAGISGAGVSGSQGSQEPVLSGDGLQVVFRTLTSDLVSGDTNGVWDVYLRDRGAHSPEIYCIAGTTQSGCQPWIFTSGAASASAGNGFTIAVAGAGGHRSALMFYGINGRAAIPWASGSTSFLCVRPPLQRMPVQNTGGTSGTCTGMLAYDWNAFLAQHAGALGQPFVAGAVVDVQVSIADPGAPKGSNNTDAVEFTVQP